MTDSIIQASLTSLKTNKIKLEIAAHNIANVDTENYARKEVNQEVLMTGSTVQGNVISGITTRSDANLENELLEKISEYGYAEVKKFYYDRMNFLMGKPGENNGIDSYIAHFFNELNSLSLHPESPSQKLIAMEQLHKMSEKISLLASGLENLRFTADREVENFTINLNAELKNAYYLNKQVSSLQPGTIEHVEAVESLKLSVQKLASYFQVRQYYNSADHLNVLTSNGLGLISPDLMYQARYNASGSVTELITDKPLKPFYMTALDNNLDDLPVILPITTAVKSSEIKHTLKFGKFAALLDMRDKEIPKTLVQLDNLAKKLKDECNRIHNEGSGYPPASELTGSKLISRDEISNFSGNLRVAIVNDQGQPISNSEIPALTLDLSKLDTGNGAGKPNVQGILQEIQYHFGQKLTVHNRVEIGGLKDIKLVAVSNAMIPGATLDLDLEIENYSGINSQIKITGVTATDSAATNIFTSFNGASYSSSSGKTVRTGLSGPSIQLTNTATPIQYPYTITVDYEVTDSTQPYTASATYTINNPSSDTFNGIKNTRFNVTNVSGSATLVIPKVESTVVNTSLIDGEGGFINSNSTNKGRIRLETTISGYHIAIDQLDSKYLGNPDANILATNEGLSSFFGLNDLFIRTDAPNNWGNIKNSAIYLKVREDILNDPNRFSSAKLRQSLQSSDPAAKPIYTYEVTSGDNSTLLDFLKLGQQSYFFPLAGNLPAVTISFASYASEIIAFNSIETSFSINEYNRQKTFEEALREKLNAIKGVDLNIELANLVLYQQAFAASAKSISVANELSEILLSVF